MKTLLGAAAALLLAQTPPLSGTLVRDEGVVQGRASIADCTGAGVSCTVTGGVWTLNAAGGGGGTPVGIARKSAQESWSDGLTHNVADMTFPVGVNEIWMFDGWMDVDPGATAPVFSLGAAATGATTHWEVSGWTAAVQRNEVRDSQTFAAAPAVGVANGRKWYPIRGIVTADGTHPYSVQITVQTSSGTITVYANSYIQFQRML